MEKNKEKFLDFSRESFLQILKIAEEKKRKYEEIGDISAVEIIEKDVIEKYEGAYLDLTEEFVEKLSEEELKKSNDYILEIISLHQLSKEFIEGELKKRKKFKNTSGAEVVKKLFLYEKKELEKRKYDLLDTANEVLNEEEKLNLELSSAIQEVDYIEILEKLNPVRTRYRKISEELDLLQKRIDLLANKLETRWRYEIFASVEEKEMLEIYNKFINKK